MTQQSLPGMPPITTEKVVNVASVKQRSPFRYPGGKTWLVPQLFRWLQAQQSVPALFIEPFAGGAIAGLTVAFERLAEHVLLVELDEQVAAVWHTIINLGEGPWLAERIRAFRLVHDTVDALLDGNPATPQELAFQTIVKNRVYHGGILAAGSGKIKHGENGKGLASRWYPETLSRRILHIHAIRERLTFVQGDGLRVMRDHADNPKAVFFIDPPYTASKKRPGSRLYTHWQLDHDHLFTTATEITGDFLMTYDNVEEVAHLAQKYGFDSRAIAMKNTHHARLSELLIGRDLNWLLD
ncbi:MAG: DNA adenine methylase [Chloroflexota bacterium]